MVQAAGQAKQAGMAPFGVYDLRCQYRQHPVGVDASAPAFSWKIVSGKRSVIQTAYQVTVASTLQKLKSDPDMWNSGKVISDQNTFVPYAGVSLNSAKQYYWQVKVWVNHSPDTFETSRSWFITGLMKQDDWHHARWIGYQALPDSMKVFPGVPGKADQLGGKARKRDVIPYFRKDFSIKKTVSQAYIFACGLGQYVLFLNGKRIDSSFLNPAWSDYTRRCYYNSYDVTGLIRQGPNAIGSLVGNGFLYITRERYHKFAIAAAYPMLRLKMIIRYSDGSTREINTDERWKTAPSPVTYSSVYGGEDFNANKLQHGWAKPGFNDNQWQSAVIVPGPGGKMESQSSYPLKVNQVFLPVHVDSSRPQIQVYDFGQNASGIIRLSARGPRGYRIRIIPSELVNADNTPNQQATGRPYYWEYTFDGKGEETWQPLFSYYGFRYAGVKVFDPAGKQVNINTVTIHSLTSLHTQNDAPPAGSFHCSDTLFNQIFRLIRWGIRNNMSHVATDCPHREKLGWLEETHLMGNSIQYNYDILRFYAKIIGDMKDAQRPDGLVPDIAPEYVIFSGGFRDSPEWGSASVLIPWYLYQWYGDKAILRDSYDMMTKYVQYLESKSVNYLLAYGLGDWFDIGPKRPGVSQLTPLGVTATAFYYYDASVVSKIAAILGNRHSSVRYAMLADSIRDAFNARFFNARTGVYATGSQSSYAIPLYFGLAPPRYRKKILANLVDSIRTHDYALTAGDIGFRYLVQALEDGGYGELIYKMNNREDVPGYGYQIKKGATALTESWQALRTVSNDHMMLGHLMEWFYSGLAGIRRQEGSVGYKKILIAPQFVKEINEVHGAYHAVNGLIAVHWNRLNKEEIRLAVSVPANTTAKIKLPVRLAGVIRERGKVIEKAKQDGILKIEKKGDVILLHIGSGKYIFTLSAKR